jgi:arsenate reductase
MAVRERVLFLCTGNSCRSQMAEGLLPGLHRNCFEALSAGAKPAGYVHPRAVTMLAELGIDIRSQTTKSILDFLPPKGTLPDVVTEVCSTAKENCPTFPLEVKRRHWPFADPFHAAGSDAEQMSEFRRVRDEIRARLSTELAT